MFGLGKTLNLIIKVFLVCLSQFCSFVLKLLEVLLFWLKFSSEKGQKSPIIYKPNASLPRRRSARLGKGLRLDKPEAQIFQV